MNAFNDQLNSLRQAAEEIVQRGNAVALTGAGISVDSGIPDFRSPGGLWERFDPMEYAHIDAFHADPVKVWRMLMELRAMVGEAKPNPGHAGLSDLERLGFLNTVI
jgi:NAD-dependent deacetylase